MALPAQEYFCERCSAVRFSTRCRECGADELEIHSNVTGTVMPFVQLDSDNIKFIYPGPAPVLCQVSGRPIVNVFYEGKVFGRGSKWYFMDEEAFGQYGVGLGFRSGLKWQRDKSGWWRRVGDYEDK